MPALPRFLLVRIAAGLAFLVLFARAYQPIDPDRYAHRDDGVITMSHARNWIDHGHIGVDPSGQRSEGYSSPLQLVLYAGAYALTGCGWAAYGSAQTWACTFLLGFAFAGLWRHRHPLTAIAASLAGAWLMALFPRFLGWHGSGMENALHHLTLIALLDTLLHALRTGKATPAIALWGFLAAITRTESIAQAGPLLIAAGFAFRHLHHHWRGMGMAAAALGLWVLVQVIRTAYFGSFTPNTGLVQGIDPAHNLALLLQGSTTHIRESGYFAAELLKAHGAWLPAILLLALPILRPGRETRILLALAALLIAAAALHPFVFGPARLDPARTTTWLSPVAAAAAIALLLSLDLPRLVRWWPLALGTAAAAILLTRAWTERPRTLCCPVHEHAEIAATARTIARQHQITRPNVAAPDLGKLSHLKQFNITDLGWLGSPILAHLRQQPEIAADYLLEFVQPDLLEVHGPWVVAYGHLLNDTRFRQLYQPLCGSADYQEEHGDLYPAVHDGLYVRRGILRQSNSPEAQLMRSLAAAPALAPIAQALSASTDTARPQAHHHVLRTAYRFLPEFRAAGLQDSLVALFARTPTAAYDQALLSSAGNPHWVREALGGILPILHGRQAARWRKGMGGYAFPLHEHGRWRFRVRGRMLAVIVQNPNWGEWHGDVLVQSFPRDKQVARSLPHAGIHHDRFRLDWTCATKVGDDFYFLFELPRWSIRKLRLGLMKSGQVLWAEDVPWPVVLP